MLDCLLAKKNYWQIKLFSDLVMVKQKENSHTPKTKAMGKAKNKVFK